LSVGWLWVGAVLLICGVGLLIGWAIGARPAATRSTESVDDRLAIYTLGGAPAAARPTARPAPTRGGPALARPLAGAVGLVARALRGRRLEARLADRLDQAALAFEPAEWVLVHAGCAVGLAVLLGLLSGGGPAAIVLGLLVGAVGPLFLLRDRAQRRKAAFEEKLADSLQLLAGSLRAGYSVPQAIDAIVREGEEPMSTEFGRALVEARLGVQLEDALESVARRMASVDFSWVVMAMRIQRDVGGNLAEVLSNVAATLRERERLRRQVRVLSAEGRLSAWILGLLPVVFGGYLLLVRPEYLEPLWTTTLGWLMLLSAAVLFVIGVFWLRRVVRVTV
jgi:tight adherence protein B